MGRCRQGGRSPPVLSEHIRGAGYPILNVRLEESLVGAGGLDSETGVTSVCATHAVEHPFSFNPRRSLPGLVDRSDGSPRYALGTIGPGSLRRSTSGRLRHTTTARVERPVTLTLVGKPTTRELVWPVCSGPPVIGPPGLVRSLLCCRRCTRHLPAPE